MTNIYRNLRMLGIALASAAGSVNAQTPVNIDLNLGNFTNWTSYTGYAATGPASGSVIMNAPTVVSPVGGSAPGSATTPKSRHAITSGPAVDHYGGFPIVCPSGTGFSARIGNDAPGAEADRIRYYIHVPAATTSYNVQYQYAAVLQDAAHPQNMQTSFQVVAYDSATGAVIPGANNMYIARYMIPGFSPYVNPSTSVVDSSIAWLPWTASTVNLSGMAGKTVILECTAYDCAAAGHWGYGYFDVTSVEDSLVVAALGFNAAGDSVTLQGPPGYMSYRFYNQNFTQALNPPNTTSRTRTVAAPATPQYYNLVITPYDAKGVADTIRTGLLAGRTNLGVGDDLLQTAQVFPNPASGHIQVRFAAPFRGTAELRNAAGALVWSGRLDGKTMAEISVAAFPAGLYSLQLRDAAGSTESRKVSIQR